MWAIEYGAEVDKVRVGCVYLEIFCASTPSAFVNPLDAVAFMEEACRGGEQERRPPGRHCGHHGGQRPEDTGVADLTGRAAATGRGGLAAGVVAPACGAFNARHFDALLQHGDVLRSWLTGAVSVPLLLCIRQQLAHP